MGGRINLSQLGSQANEALRPENMGRYAANFVRSTSAGKRLESLYNFDSENLSPERLSQTAEEAAKTIYRSAIDRVLGKISKYKQSGLGKQAYRSAVRKYVERVLGGDDLGAEVNEVSANWLRDLKYVDETTGKKGKSPLGFNERVYGRSLVYIPKVSENLGRIAVSQGVQDYIRVHEVLETNWQVKPRTEQEHEFFDAMILSALKDLMKTNARARQAYRGALSVYEARGEDDPYFRGVSKFYPVREEISSNVFRSTNSNEGVQRFALAA